LSPACGYGWPQAAVGCTVNVFKDALLCRRRRVQELQGGDPRRIGPYRLVGRLGAGGMGMVFAGRSAGGRAVAVKVIRGELAGDPEFRVRFSREVAAARSVSGLFTAPVVDADVDGPMPWLATAYVPGPSLSDAVREHGALPPASVLALAAGLAEGLAAIHAAGLIHRDLKPSNVLLAEDGPRVIDFGISRAAEATALTHADLVIGSPGFMSPEQAEGRETGPPSDVFSFGAVLAFAASGQGPFGSGSTAALVYRVVHGPPDLDKVPAEVRPLAERCLAKDPGQRPTTAQLLAELDGADLAAGWLPAPVSEELSRRAEIPDPEPVSSLEAGRLTVTAARPGQAPSPPPPQARAGSLPGAAPRRRRRPAMVALMLAGVLAVASGGTAIGINLAGGKPAGDHRSGGPRASATAQRSRALTAAGPGSSPSGRAPAAPTDVVATAINPHTIRVTWVDSANDATGFNIGNGCGTDGCSGGAINVRTGRRVTATDVTTSPGAYQCFFVQAFNGSGTSTSAVPGCTSTPGINIPSNQEWTDTGVTVRSGAAVGISANGNVYLAAAGSSQAPGGDSSCKPATNYAAHSSQFPAPQLPCWSLIARIGNGQPFEVGDSILITATTGRLYLGVNDNSFSGNTGIWAVKIKIGGLP
jgi:serine/threonine protein kinase